MDRKVYFTNFNKINDMKIYENSNMIFLNKPAGMSS